MLARTPQIGDTVHFSLDEVSMVPHHRMRLAVRFGIDPLNPGCELWLAWDHRNGRLWEVSVGRYWVLDPLTG